MNKPPYTWYYYPIEMPLIEGNGPASIKECDEMTYEVWDVHFNEYGSYKTLFEAIARAMELNETLEREYGT